MEWQELMKDVISETLEKMFFNIVEFEGEGEPSSDSLLSTHIKLGSEKDAITIIISLEPAFARQLTADFMGKIVDDITEADTEDCMKELANMIGGGAVARLGGTYRLELPRLGEATPNAENYEEEIIPVFVLGTPVGKVRLYREILL